MHTQNTLKKKEYWSQKNESLDTFTPDALLSALGIDRDRRFAPSVPPGCPAVRADRTLLEAILFNATQNAALHGAAHRLLHRLREPAGRGAPRRVRRAPHAPPRQVQRRA